VLLPQRELHHLLVLGYSPLSHHLRPQVATELLTQRLLLLQPLLPVWQPGLNAVV
jgi:hypothetical protein